MSMGARDRMQLDTVPGLNEVLMCAEMEGVWRIGIKLGGRALENGLVGMRRRK